MDATSGWSRVFNSTRATHARGSEERSVVSYTLGLVTEPLLSARSTGRLWRSFASYGWSRIMRLATVRAHDRVRLPLCTTRRVPGEL